MDSRHDRRARRHRGPLGRTRHPRAGACRRPVPARRSALALHRPERQPRRRDRRRAGQPDGRLRRRRVGRHLEDRERRRELEAGVRSREGQRHRRARRRRLRAPHGLGRHGRDVPHPAVLPDGRRRLQIDRRRRPLAAHGPRRDRPRRPHRDRSRTTRIASSSARWASSSSRSPSAASTARSTAARRGRRC